MTNSRRGDRRAQVALVCLLVTIGALVGYAMSSWTPRERIDDTYGKRHGIYGGRSVNGTAVLAGMFEKRGGRASSWDRLSPRLTRADTIVWAPDNSQVPESDQIAWFETWLHGGKNRTLIYIGRDYDAEVEYWQDVMPTVPAKQAQEAAKRLSDAKKDRASVRSGLSREAGAQWFKIRRDRPPRKITSFAGRWRFHIDSQKANILVGERIVIDSSQGGLVLLNGWSDEHQSDDPEPLVVAFEKGEVQRKNQLIVAANGSFLLNYPLINHEHRKLASLLIDHCHGLDDVVFLQSDKAGPPIVEEDPVLRQPGALEMSAVWPLSAIIPHVVALGIILCFALFPIFGRAKNLPQENRSDFAKHIDALGTLMARTKDYSYAQERVTHYQQRVKRDSSVSHSSPSVAKTTADAENLSQPYQPRDTGAIHFDLPYPALPPFVKPLAEAAIKTVRDQHGISLDYSSASIEQVDQIILGYFERGQSATLVGAAVFGLGCYVGQIMVQQFGGQWKEPSETTLRSGAGPYMVVELSGDGLWNPIGKAFKLLENGVQDRLSTFYQLVTQTRDNT